MMKSSWDTCDGMPSVLSAYCHVWHYKLTEIYTSQMPVLQPLFPGQPGYIGTRKKTILHFNEAKDNGARG